MCLENSTNCQSEEEPKETRGVNVMWYPGWDSETSDKCLKTLDTK